MTPTLKRRVFQAGTWNLAGSGLSQAIRFVSNLVMTRLLVPEMFGVMAIASTIMIGLMMFSDVGLRQNIVQSKRGNDDAFLNTAWVIQILRGVLLWLLALGLSLLVVLAYRSGMVPAGSVFAEPTLPYVIAVVSINAVIMGFESTKSFEASRNLSLGRITQLDLISQTAGLLTMLCWVAFDRSIWALVAGSTCSTLAKTILSHVWLEGVANHWQWDHRSFQEIVHLGKWIFVSSILGFLVSNGDRLLLGGLINSADLGIYVIAFLIFGSVEQVLTKIMGDVAYPALSEVARERPADLKSTYYRFHLLIASFTFFCAGVLMASGSDLIRLLYDPRYEQAGWMLEILAVALLTVPFRVALLTFMALGMARLHAEIIAIRVIALFILVPAGFHFFGLRGALWGITVSYFSVLPMIIFYKMRHGLFDLHKELLAITALLFGILLAKALILAIGQ